MLAIRLWLSVALAFTATAAAADPLTLEEALRRAHDTYEPLQLAAMQVDRARLERDKVEAQLGWNLGASAGVSHDLSFIGEPVDRVSGGAAVERALESGRRVGVSAEYAYEDNAFSFSPALPNPANIANLDLNYRIPLRQGEGNPAYTQGLAAAAARVGLSEAELDALRQQVAQQVIDLYFASARVRALMDNARAAIARAERLREFVRENERLGLAEDKDILQAEAQVRARGGDLRALEVAWERQRTALNRLTARRPRAEFDTEPAPSDRPTGSTDALVAQAEASSPALQRNAARVALAETVIEQTRDAARDQMDVVLSAGTRTRFGDADLGDVNDSELAGGVRIEYTRALDRRGFDAELQQALLDRDIARDEMKVIRDDLRYDIEGLVSEIDSGTRALRQYRRQLAAERAKMDDALERYRSGRIDTATLIQFEAERRAAELAVETQAVDIQAARARLDLLRGALWPRVAPGTAAPRNASP
jgi:outer membrane protein TolC